MAKKTRVSFIREMIIVAIRKGLSSGSRQVSFEFHALSLFTEETIKANDPPRTASHEQAKKATTHGFLLNTARVRRKKRRDVNTTTAQSRIISRISSLIHVGFDRTEENQKLVMKIALEYLSSLIICFIIAAIENQRHKNLVNRRT